jgi:hypothetical protein
MRLGVGVEGTLGTYQGARWAGEAAAEDPFHITAEDLMDMPEQMDLMVLVSLEEGNVSENGHINFHAYLEDYSGQINLLNWSMSSTDTQLSNDNGQPYSISFYRAPTDEQLNDESFDFRSNPLSADEIKTMPFPINLAIEITGVPKPTVAMDGDGTVLELHYDLGADDHAEASDNPDKED